MAVAAEELGEEGVGLVLDRGAGGGVNLEADRRVPVELPGRAERLLPGVPADEVVQLPAEGAQRLVRPGARRSSA